MLCVSILSEVVLGFMLWSGVLGGAYPAAPADPECNCAPCSCKENCKCASCACDGCPGKPGVACSPVCPTGCGPGFPCALANPATCPTTDACPCVCCPVSGACGNPGACPFTGACPFAGGCPFAASAPLPPPCCISPQCGQPAQAPSCQVSRDPFLFDTPFALTAPSYSAGGHFFAYYDQSSHDCHLLGSRLIKRTKDGVVLELQLRGVPGEVFRGKRKVHFDVATTPCPAAQPRMYTEVVMNPQPMNALWQPMPAPMHMQMPAPYMPFAMPGHMAVATMPAPAVPVSAGPWMPQAAQKAAQQCRLPDPMPMPPFPQPAMPGVCVPPQGIAYPAMEYVSAMNTTPAPRTPERAMVRLVYESGKPQLYVKSHGLTTQAVRMKLEAGTAGSVRLAAGKNLVHIHGTKWKAQAERIELGDDGRVVLAGHVKLTSDKLGTGASVKADRMCVQVKSGKFETIVEQK